MAKIIGHGPPTKHTPGALSSEYFDKDAKQVYICTNVKHITAFRAGEADAEYEWIEAGGNPFKVEKKTVEIYPQTTFTVVPDPVTTSLKFPMTKGKNYVVNYNGEAYNLKSYTLTSAPTQLEGAVLLGNAIHSPWEITDAKDTGEDFLLVQLANGAVAFCFPKSLLLKKATFQIDEEQEIATPIDYKFMPEGYPKVEKKMVEIVPEQSVTGNDDVGICLAYIDDGFSIKDNTKYIVKINGATYTSITFMDGGQSPILGQLFYDNSANEPYEIYNSLVGKTELSISWSASLGETITLAIYEEQEVVQQIDPKFVGASGSAILNFSRDSDDSLNICDNTFEVFDNAYKNRKPINATFTEYTLNEHNIGYLDNYISWDDGSYVLTFRRLEGGDGFSYGLSKGRVIKQIRWYPDGRIEDYEIVD